MTNASPQWQQVQRAIERGFESIAEDLDQIANAYELNSSEMKHLIRDWDFEDYYGEWMSEGWE